MSYFIFLFYFLLPIGIITPNNKNIPNVGECVDMVIIKLDGNDTSSNKVEDMREIEHPTTAMGNPTTTNSEQWLELLIEGILHQKRMSGRNYSLYSGVKHEGTSDEICYLDEHENVLIYTLKKDITGTYLIELEEIEKISKGICSVNIYMIGLSKKTAKSIFQITFEDQVSLRAKSEAARFCCKVREYSFAHVKLISQREAVSPHQVYGNYRLG